MILNHQSSVNHKLIGGEMGGDTIWGIVKTVIDGDTFDMKVTHVGKNNLKMYNDEERIRIADIDEPEVNTLAGIYAKSELHGKLHGKDVRCHIKARDTYGRLVAMVAIV